MSSIETDPIEPQRINLLVNEHAYLVKAQVRRRRGAAKAWGIDVEELEQAGFLALWEAARRFDPAVGPFVHLAEAYIGTAIRGVFAERRRRRAPDFFDPAIVDAMQERGVAAGRDRDELADVVWGALWLAPGLVGRVGCLRYGIGDNKPRSIEEIAFTLRIGRDAVAELEDKALQWVERAIAEHFK